MTVRKTKIFLILFITVILILPSFGVNTAEGQSIGELKEQIEDRNSKIQKLNKEIKIYEKEIEQTGKKANTLKNTIKGIDTSQKKIGTQIKITENSIQKNQFTIKELAIEINSIEKAINNNAEAVSIAIRELQRLDDTSMVEIILSYKNLSQLWDKIASIESFQNGVKEKTAELNKLNNQLSIKLSSTEKRKRELSGFKKDLKDQNYVLQSSKNTKSSLLKETKNKESEYKRILNQKIAAKELFEKELFQYESQLKIAIDPDSYPTGNSSILSWPLKNIYITQYFGKTVDSKRLYKSGTHNGMDLRAPMSTPVKAALSGTIQAVGNTDLQRGCYSYGKWVLIKHPNGLSTLYAHLSLIKAKQGQNVSTGQTIAYSGNTGFSTGPHLHLTVYASQGVRVQRYSNSINCKNVTIPLADPRAYLDPIPYLPKL